jgi:hypothetical protein
VALPFNVSLYLCPFFRAGPQGAFLKMVKPFCSIKYFLVLIKRLVVWLD